MVDIHSMNAETFIEYTELIDFPSLSDVQEEEIRNDVEQLVQEYYPDTSEEKQESIIHTLINAVKFFALFVSNFIIFSVANVYITNSSNNYFKYNTTFVHFYLIESDLNK